MEKYILPDAMNCGCGYELFWTLNPHKLESFYESRRMKMENDLDTQNFLAWLNGVYVVEAIASNFSKHHSYPKEPKDLKDKRGELEAPPGDSMSDGQRFYLFMLEHNRAVANKRRRHKREE